MATINVYQAQDGSKTYRVRIRRRGEQSQTATFSNLKDAKRWATMIEGQIIEGRHFPNKKTPHTLNELLDRYERDIMPKKTEETQRTHGYVITFWRERLGQKLLTDITKADILRSKDELRGKAAGTICKYLTILNHPLNTAIKDYNWLETNVVSLVSRPSLPPVKMRFLTDEERCRLLRECERSKNPNLYALVSLALYTGLRRGALLHLKREDIDMKNRTITIGKTKNKSTLVLPIVGEAYEIINELYSKNTMNAYLFPAQGKRERGKTYQTAFEQAVKRANISNFSFHSLRHTAASYMIQAGVPLYTVGAVLNHRNPATITYRYAHLQTENLREALEVLAQRLEGKER